MKTVEEFERDFCERLCGSKEGCPYIPRNLQHKCDILNNVSWGYEMALDEMPKWKRFDKMFDVDLSLHIRENDNHELVLCNGKYYINISDIINGLPKIEQ